MVACEYPGCGEIIESTKGRRKPYYCKSPECQRKRNSARVKKHYRIHKARKPAAPPTSYRILRAANWPEGVILSSSTVREFLRSGSFDDGDVLLLLPNKKRMVVRTYQKLVQDLTSPQTPAPGSR